MIPVMKLDQWLNNAKKSRAAFARALGVSRFTVWRYETGERFPRPEYLARINELTKGKVSPADFVALQQEKTRG